MTNAEKALQYFIIAVPEDKEQAEAYFWARRALNAAIRAEREEGDHASIDREAWEPCERCTQKGEKLDRFGAHDFQIDGTEIYFHDTDDGWEGEEINFCPWCGRPLTEEAWAESLERIRKFSPCISCQHYNPDLLPDLPFECVACAMDSSSHYPKYTKITDAKEGE